MIPYGDLWRSGPRHSEMTCRSFVPFPGMTRSIEAHADVSAPARESLESILRKDVLGLRDKVGSLVSGNLSAEEASSVLEYVSGLRARVRNVASVLKDPSPSSVSAYLRTVASDASSVRSARHTASSLKLLQAVLARR
jgi:hypothetical protein